VPPTVSIDKGSLIVNSLPAIIKGSASGSKVVGVDIMGTNDKYGYINVFTEGNVPVVNGKWSVTIPEGTFKGFSGPYKFEVGIINKSGKTLDAIDTGVLTVN